jgi:hypothetical protein
MSSNLLNVDGMANDDRSPLIDLLTCIGCEVTMKIEKSAPDETAELN